MCVVMEKKDESNLTLDILIILHKHMQIMVIAQDVDSDILIKKTKIRFLCDY